ncbi:MAG TPA: hypothetical protein VMH23_04450 [Bacteroidota bacterium]|nr:hypothetical protein [Bacteroidota bacterium]
MKLSYATFAVGVIYGFGLGVILDKEDLVSVASFSLLIVFLLSVPAVVWYEMYAHRLRMSKWTRIRSQGKLLFVAGRYVLLRGGILVALLMYALRGRVGSLPVHEFSVPFLVAAIAFIGHQEWENCEHEAGSLHSFIDRRDEDAVE